MRKPKKYKRRVKNRGNMKLIINGDVNINYGHTPQVEPPKEKSWLGALIAVVGACVAKAIASL